jgi:hypothetical protein
MNAPEIIKYPFEEGWRICLLTRFDKDYAYILRCDLETKLIRIKKETALANLQAFKTSTTVTQAVYTLEKYLPSDNEAISAEIRRLYDNDQVFVMP